MAGAGGQRQEILHRARDLLMATKPGEHRQIEQNKPIISIKAWRPRASAHVRERSSAGAR
jgi:hypothetical protein